MDDDYRKYLNNIGMRSVILPGLSAQPSSKPPVIPRGLFDEMYKLPTSPQCRVPGKEKECIKTCEPGLSDKHGENLLLLPGEEEYLKKRFEEEGIEWKWEYDSPVVVPIHTQCPYYEDRVCTIHDLRPFVCRSYPLRCHKIGAYSLAVFSAIGCPFRCDSAEGLSSDQHHMAWIGAWKALMPYLPDKWWKSFERACPAGFKHLGDIVDPEEKKVPVSVIRKYATKGCEHCGGIGVTDGGEEGKSGVCRCITPQDVQSIRDEMKEPHNRFYS